MADLARMGETATATPTYYGDAWNALAKAMLTGDALGGCPPLDAPSSTAAGAASSGAVSSAADGFQDPVAPEAASNAVPEHISIPAIGVESDLIGLGLGGDGWIESPADFNAVGWYQDGVVPGAIGPAVIAGHVDSPTAPAVFYDLPKLTQGDTVAVSRSDGTVANFVVTTVRTVEKDSFPTESIYAPVPTPELRLVTCGGAWDPASGHYVDNVVVTAVSA
jgi:LPXTG-site transpeptidase (sortase) family protein